MYDAGMGVGSIVLTAYAKGRARRAQLLARFEAGEDLALLATEAGVQEAWMQTLIERARQEIPQLPQERRSKLPDAEVSARRERLLLAREAGKTLKDLAQQEGITPERVRQIVHSAIRERYRRQHALPAPVDFVAECLRSHHVGKRKKPMESGGA